MPTPSQVIPEVVLQQLSERIERCTGLHFPASRFADLERGLVEAARDVGCREVRTYAEALLQRDLQTTDIETLAGSLTIGETHFFRDPHAFTFLETTLLPELIAAKRMGDRRLRFWSAGCATGEEPYSLAMLLHRLLPDLSDWSISILGTDINPKFLARAEVGVYTEWSFRDTPDWVKPRYFLTHPGHRYELQPWLKRRVRFACLNLVDDAYPSIVSNTIAMDLIVCRNVLLYFAPTRATQVVKRFHRALVDGGLLLFGAVEASQIDFGEFTPLAAPSVALYRKDSGPAKTKPDAGNVAEATRMARENEAAAAQAAAFREPPTVLALAPACHAPRVAAAPSPAATGVPPADFGSRARACANLGELAEALVCCDRALADAKTDAGLHFLRAGILQELQRDGDALQALRNVVFLAPSHVLAHFALANLQHRQGRLSVAAKHLANARQLLAGREESEELPDSGGLTVGSLSGMLIATAGMWKLTGAASGGRHA